VLFAVLVELFVLGFLVVLLEDLEADELVLDLLDEA